MVIAYADWRIRVEDPRFPVGQARLEAIGVLACESVAPGRALCALLGYGCVCLSGVLWHSSNGGPDRGLCALLGCGVFPGHGIHIQQQGVGVTGWSVVLGCRLATPPLRFAGTSELPELNLVDLPGSALKLL